MEKIGFIGLGIMGFPMAQNLAKGGHTIIAPERSSLSAEARAAFTIVEDATAVAAAADIIIVMVPDTPDVERVLFGAQGVAAGLSAGNLVIDMSSISPTATKDFAAEECAKMGVKPVIEPINHRDIPGFFLNTTNEATRIIDALGMERVGLQFDLYHCQITEGDVTRKAAELLPYIAHMQVADTPGRHEPGTGEVNWDFVFNAIDASGYRGWIGCEYRPKGETLAGLGWFAKYRV